MSSQSPAINKAAALGSNKSSASLAAQPTIATSQVQHYFHDTSARRSGGASASNARPGPAPRNSQTAKPKHKQAKKFRALDEDDEAEAFSMQNPHGRRGQQSITHLMQFALPPRPSSGSQYQRHSHGPRRSGRANPTWGLGSGRHAGDKARYIHANYRFIVDPRGDFTAQAHDADVHLEWDNVLQIIASSKTQAASCPICLGEPVAPRMAKCGHMFCLSCLIRYMHSDDGDAPPEKRARWKKCPICWDSIYVSETKPVRWYVGQESDSPHEGCDVVLRLVRRRPNSTIAMPRESAEALAKGDAIPWYFAAEVMDYVRVMKGSEDYMLQQYDEALSAVELQEKEDELMFGEDTQWTRRAIRLLQEAQEKVRGIGNPPAQPTKPAPAELAMPVERVPEIWDEENASVSESHLLKEANPLSSANPDQINASEERYETDNVPRTLTEMRQRQTEKPQPAEYLFYQGLLHYYLSPLDIRILKSAFGSYSSFPSSLLPRVERVSSGHMVDDDLRKRIKYLSHLPYGCEVAFLECDWRDVVNAHVLEEFRPMLERRRKKNEEKDAREEKERVRIERAEERELASIRYRRRPSIPESDPFFATASLATSPALLSSATAELSGSHRSSEFAASQSPTWTSHANRPGFSSLASPGTSPMMPRTVWGTASVVPTSPELNAALRDDHRPEDDGWLQGWERDLLDTHTEQIIGEMDGLNVQAKPVGGKKGKKNKKITLMSTATARRGA